MRRRVSSSPKAVKFMGDSRAQSELTISQLFDLSGRVALVTGGCGLPGNRSRWPPRTRLKEELQTSDKPSYGTQHAHLH